jgi:hypothetical protein
VEKAAPALFSIRMFVPAFLLGSQAGTIAENSGEVVGNYVFWGATAQKANVRTPILLTSSPFPAVAVSQTFRSICVQTRFSGSK